MYGTTSLMPMTALQHLHPEQRREGKKREKWLICSFRKDGMGGEGCKCGSNHEPSRTPPREKLPNAYKQKRSTKEHKTTCITALKKQYTPELTNPRGNCCRGRNMLYSLLFSRPSPDRGGKCPSLLPKQLASVSQHPLRQQLLS